MARLAVRSCVARQEPYIPGALSILQGTVPGRVRGSGHMVPTYFRRELRDRVLQRPSRLRTFCFVVFVGLPQSSLMPSPRKRGIQYAAASRFYHEGSGMPDHPLLAGDDGGVGGDKWDGWGLLRSGGAFPGRLRANRRWSCVAAVGVRYVAHPVAQATPA